MALALTNQSQNTPVAAGQVPMLLAHRASAHDAGPAAASGGAPVADGSLAVRGVQGRSRSQAEQSAMRALGVLREASATLQVVAGGLGRAAQLATQAAQGPDVVLDQALHQVLGELEPLVHGTHPDGSGALDGTTLSVDLVHGPGAVTPVTTLAITLPDIAGTLFGEGGLDELRLDVAGAGGQAKQAVAAALSEVDAGQRHLRSAGGQLTTALAQLGAGRGAPVDLASDSAQAVQVAARLCSEIASAPGLALRAHTNPSVLATALLERA